MTSVSKNVCTADNLDDLVNKSSNIYHSTIKMKPADVMSSTYINFKKGNDKHKS